MNPTDYIHFDPKTLTTEVRYKGKVLFSARLYNWGESSFFGIDFSGPYAEQKKMLSLAAGTCLFREQADELVSRHCRKCVETLLPQPVNP